MKMKIVLLMLVAMFATAQAEMLTNPGFEDGTYGAKNVPYGWSMFYPSYTSQFTWHSTGGVGGGKCLQLAYQGLPYTYYTGFAGQYVAVTPGETYTFSVWAKSPTQGVPANPYGYYTWYTSGWAWIAGGYGFLYPTGASTVGDTWTQVNFGDLVAPEGAAYMGCFLYGNSAGCLYDNASLVPEPVTLGLLGLGALMLRRRK